MSESIESQGKSVEEAVSEALLKLGARKDEIEVKILDEGKSGFLGVFGAKPARVLVRRKQHSRGRPQGGSRRRGKKSDKRDVTSEQESRPRGGAATTVADQRGDRPASRTNGPRTNGSRSDRSRRSGVPGSDAAGTATARGDDSAGYNRKAAPQYSSSPAPSVPLGDATAATSLATPLRGVKPEEAPQSLQDIAEKLMTLSSFPCRCEVVEGDYHLVRIITDGDSAGVLIGRHGTTVDAIEHLVERMASQACGERVNMNLDVNNYRRRREESLVQRIHEIMEKVSLSGKEVHMEPMCARERRIVHLEVVNDSDLRTYTITAGSGKQVVVAKEERPGEAVDE